MICFSFMIGHLKNSIENDLKSVLQTIASVRQPKTLLKMMFSTIVLCFLFISHVYSMRFVLEHQYVNKSCAATSRISTEIFVSGRCSSLAGFSRNVTFVDQNTVSWCINVASTCKGASCYQSSVSECDETDDKPTQYATDLGVLPPLLTKLSMRTINGNVNIVESSYSITGEM
jgi:hypothetical protein